MWHVASNGLDAVVSCCSHSERDFWCVVRPQCKNNWSDSSDLVVSVVEAGADFHSRGSCVCVCVRLCVCVFTLCVYACTYVHEHVCVFVHSNVVGDSADRCVMTAYHCRCARVRVAGGPFWHVFSPRLHLCLWHSELGLTKEKQGGEVGVYWVPMSEAGWG